MHKVRDILRSRSFLILWGFYFFIFFALRAQAAHA